MSMIRVDREALDLAATYIRAAHDMLAKGYSARDIREKLCEGLYHARAAMYSLDEAAEKERYRAERGEL